MFYRCVEYLTEGRGEWFGVQWEENGGAALSSSIKVDDVAGEHVWGEQGLEGRNGGHGRVEGNVGKEDDLGLVRDARGCYNTWRELRKEVTSTRLKSAREMHAMLESRIVRFSVVLRAPHGNVETCGKRLGVLEYIKHHVYSKAWYSARNVDLERGGSPHVVVEIR